MSSDRRVLIISNPEDQHASRVQGNIRAAGGSADLFFPELLGQKATLSLGRRDGRILVNAAVGDLDLTSYKAIWFRRPRPPQLPIKGYQRRFALEEWRGALEEVYSLLEPDLWVSHPDLERRARRKQLQAKVAARLGFQIPRTIVTSDPDEAASFISSIPGPTVAKAVGSGWVSAGRSAVLFVLTNRLTSQDIEHLGSLRVAPVMLQEEVPKRHELRVNVIGRTVLAIRIESQQSPVSSLDWRRYDVANTPYVQEALSDVLLERCRRLVSALGLQFGAIDLIVRPDGGVVFLEVNPSGQFLWAEELSGSPVTDTVAQLLVGEAPPLHKEVIDYEGH